MNTQIISLSVENLNSFEDEKIILDYFQKQNRFNCVTVNIVDRNMLISGDNISLEMIVYLLNDIGYKVAS